MRDSSRCGAILIVIDGCRPDGIQEAETPHIDTLIARGAYTFGAQSVMPSSTLPCHTSMFRGVTPSRHGITTNTWVPMVRPVPSITELASSMKLKTAFIYNWEQLRDLAAPGSLNFSYFTDNLDKAKGDVTIAQVAAEHLCAEQPDFCFVYLGVVDIVGHRHGWMSAEYIEQIGIADQAIGVLLARLEAANLLDRYLILVQSDHGGHGKSHGTDLPEDLTIPWIAAGGPVKSVGEIKQPLRIFDTAPTLAHALDLPLSDEWEGQPITDIF
ncbi:MAG: ectonucleotide pyrophosphatase/phosphodiesterase [Candidatus Poribacteria bacterium]|nr:ectonucleotide pyrophosphatase/phosphodiesterase [Candidatus Poribacteria bacterium]